MSFDKIPICLKFDSVKTFEFENFYIDHFLFLVPRRPSPGPREPMPSWERLDHMGEPQGIPVIGGVKPQPIPSLANRGGPVRPDYDHLGRPMAREDEFKMQPDYWMANEQQAALRNTSQWDPPAGGREARPAHWSRPVMR